MSGVEGLRELVALVKAEEHAEEAFGELLAGIDEVHEATRKLREAAYDWAIDHAPALLERIAALEADARRYRFIADGARDVVFCCSATDFGDGDTTWGPRAEVLDEQFPVAIEGSPKAKLDAAIDAALDAARVGG